MDAVDRGASERLVPGDRRLVADVADVEQVMRDAAALGDRKLRRADVHAPIQLHGVSIDDLRRIALLSKRLGEV